MAVTIRHNKVATLPDQQGAEINKNEWNEAHVVEGLSTVAETGSYDDLTDKPTLGTASAQDIAYFATAAQGALADSAIQTDLISYSYFGGM